MSLPKKQVEYLLGVEDQLVLCQDENQDLYKMLDNNKTTIVLYKKQLSDAIAQVEKEKGLHRIEVMGLNKKVRKQKVLKYIFLIGPPILYGGFKIMEPKLNL